MVRGFFKSHPHLRYLVQAQRIPSTFHVFRLLECAHVLGTMIGGTLDIHLDWMRCFGGVCTSFWLSERLALRRCFETSSFETNYGPANCNEEITTVTLSLTPAIKVSCILNRSMADCSRVLAGCCPPLFFLLVVSHGLLFCYCPFVPFRCLDPLLWTSFHSHSLLSMFFNS